VCRLLNMNLLFRIYIHDFRTTIVIIIHFYYYPRESEGIYFHCVGLSVCLSAATITKKSVDGFVLNFMGRFLGERKTKFVFPYDR